MKARFSNDRFGINRETLLHKFVEQFLITLSTTVKSFTLVVSRKLAQNITTIQRAGIPARRHSSGFDAGALTPNKGIWKHAKSCVFNPSILIGLLNLDIYLLPAMRAVDG